MSSAQSDDPTVQLWHKARRFLIGFVFLVLALGEVPRLLSGELFPTVTGLLLVAFWVSLSWRPVLPPGDRSTSQYWRSSSRSNARWWTSWLLIATGWLTWASFLHGFRGAGLVVVAVPALGLLGCLFGYRKAERLAEVHAERSSPTS
jgi:uncharacterized membrane protein YfcA